MAETLDAETRRLAEDAARQTNWKRWGPYLASASGAPCARIIRRRATAGTISPRQSRSRAYRWGEDGLLGITDRECRLCFALALWNGRDPSSGTALRSGRAGRQSWRGCEGVLLLPRLDADALVREVALQISPCGISLRAAGRGKPAARPAEGEFELIESGVFNENRYFDLFAEYAKASPDDILIRLSVANRGPEAAPIHLLPTLWFGTRGPGIARRRLLDQAAHCVGGKERARGGARDARQIPAAADRAPEGKTPQFLFTDNETNFARVSAPRIPTPT